MALEYAEKLAVDHHAIDDAFFERLRAEFSDPEILPGVIQGLDGEIFGIQYKLAAAHALTQGAIAELRGGNFKTGAVGALVPKLLEPMGGTSSGHIQKFILATAGGTVDEEE